MSGPFFSFFFFFFDLLLGREVDVAMFSVSCACSLVVVSAVDDACADDDDAVAVSDDDVVAGSEDAIVSVVVGSEDAVVAAAVTSSILTGFNQSVQNFLCLK